MIGTVIFFVVYILASLLVYRSRFTHKYKKYYVIAAIFILILLLTFRNVGTDTEIYANLFSEIKTQDNSIAWNRIFHDTLEPAVVLLSLLGKYIGYDFRFILFIHAAVTITFLYIASVRISKERGWLLFLLLLWTVAPLGFNTMRQTAAIAIMLLAFTFLLNYKNIKSVIYYVLLSILAVSFHLSAAIVSVGVAAGYVYKRIAEKNNNRIIQYVIPMCLIALSLLVSYALLSSTVFSDYLPFRYAEMMKSHRAGLYLSYNYILMIATYVAIIVMHRKKLTGNINMLYMYTIVAGLIISSPSWFSAYIGRITDYFLPIVIITLTLCFMPVIKKYYKYPEAVFILVAIIYFILNYLVMGNGEFMPFSMNVFGCNI